MKRHLHNTVPVLCLPLLLFSCSKQSTSRDVSSWLGDYVYKENPVEAVQGIYRTMEWQLNIHVQNDSCKGVLEMMGDRTYVKALTTIQGDSNNIDVVFNRMLDGADENFIEGETLFSITKNNGKLITTWDRLEPRLATAPPQQCDCFVTTKKKKKSKSKKKRK